MSEKFGSTFNKPVCIINSYHPEDFAEGCAPDPELVFLDESIDVSSITKTEDLNNIGIMSYSTNLSVEKYLELLKKEKIGVGYE